MFRQKEKKMKKRNKSSNASTKRRSGHSQKQPQPQRSQTSHTSSTITTPPPEVTEKKEIVADTVTAPAPVPVPPVQAFRYPSPPKYNDVTFDPVTSTQQKTTLDEILGSWNGREVDPECDEPEESEVDFNHTKVRSRYRNEIEKVHDLFQVAPQVEKVLQRFFFFIVR